MEVLSYSPESKLPFSLELYAAIVQSSIIEGMFWLTTGINLQAKAISKWKDANARNLCSLLVSIDCLVKTDFDSSRGKF